MVHWFNCKKLEAFHILLVKDLYPLTLDSDNFKSLPGFNKDVKVTIQTVQGSELQKSLRYEQV